MDSPGNSHCGKPRYIGLRLALHILVVTKMSPPPLVSYSSLSCDAESPYLSQELLCCAWAQGIHLNDTNLKIGIWALNLEHVMFFSLWTRFQRAPQKRESPTHTQLALVHNSSCPLQHPVLRMTLQKQES